MFCFALAVAGLRVAGPDQGHESAILLIVLNWTFTTLICVFIAFLAGRSFLVSAEPIALMLCCAMVIWGSSAAVAVTGSRVGNYNITIHNLGMFAAALCHLVGALLATHFKLKFEPGGVLALAIACSMTLVGFIWMGAQEDWFPVFFIQGHGSTFIRDTVLIFSIAMYALTATLMWRRHRLIGSEFLRWYALGIALLGIGAIGLALQTIHGSALGWTARAAQYCAGLYMLVGAILGVRELHAWQLPLTIALKEAQNEFELLFHSINDGIMLYEAGTDLEPSKLMRTNDVLCHLLGYSREECNKLHPSSIFTEEHRTDLTGAYSINQERILLAKDGHRIPAEISTRTFEHRGKHMVLSVIRDITQRKLAEQSLRDADKSKDEFLAILAHELRNPLAPMKNSLEIMKRAQGNSSLIEQARSMIDRQLSKMVRLVDDLLDASRFARGKVELKMGLVDLTSVVQDAVEAIRPLVNSHSMVLSVHLPTEPCPVEADRVRLEQVFSNLLSNAVKYGKRGGHISLRVQDRDGSVEVTIKDDGIGIPTNMLANVFELFVQVDHSLGRLHEGLGIGLTLVKWLVELHGGTVSVQSELGIGSEFTVRLPLAMSLAAKQEEPTICDISYRPRRILVADDNLDIAATLAGLLKMIGHEVRTANNGAEAVEIAQSFRPHLILLDIGMPKLTGYEACRQIRAHEWSKDMLIVALTGWSQESDRMNSKIAGFDDHIIKPVDMTTLSKLIASSIETDVRGYEERSS